MHDIRKSIITDADMRPIAVQIDYADWLEIEHSLGLLREEQPVKERSVDPSQFAGTVSLSVDPVAFQTQLRNEWL
jgi:hypothetical protein